MPSTLSRSPASLTIMQVTFRWCRPCQLLPRLTANDLPAGASAPRAADFATSCQAVDWARMAMMSARAVAVIWRRRG